MPDRTFNFSQNEGLDPQDEGITFVNGTIKLRPANDEGISDFSEKLKTKYIDLPTWCPHGDVFDYFCGFLLGCHGKGKVRFQISPDAGETFLWHDGTSWELVENGDDYNSQPEIEATITDFPTSWTTLRIRMFLIPDGNCSPIVNFVTILFEMKPHDFRQDIYRSLRKFIIDSSNFVLPYEIELDSPTDTMTLTFEDIGIEGEIEKTITIKEPIWVYELSDDPESRNNLFESFEKPNIIRLKKSVIGHIKVLFTTIPDVHINTDFDVIPMANHPSIVLQITSARRSEWDGPGNYPCREFNFSKLIAKTREGLRKWEVLVNIKAYSSKVTDSLMFTGGIRTSIEQEDRILSVFYDTFMQAIWGTHVNINWVTQNWFVETYSPAFIWEDWSSQGKAKEVPLVDTPENGGGVISTVFLLDDC